MASYIRTRHPQQIGPSQKQNGRTGRRRSVRFTAGAGIGALVLAVALGAPGAIASTPQPPRQVAATASRTLDVTDTAHLKLAHNGGEYIIEEGVATGSLPGKVRATLEIGPTVVAKFTIYTSAGTISGQGSGKPKGRSEEPSFAGVMSVSHGTGRYQHAHGRGGFYGTLNRVSYKMVVQTTGDLSY